MVILSSDSPTLIEIQGALSGVHLQYPFMKDHLPIAAIYGNYFYYDTEVVQKTFNTGEHSRQISQ